MDIQTWFREYVHHALGTFGSETTPWGSHLGALQIRQRLQAVPDAQLQVGLDVEMRVSILFVDATAFFDNLFHLGAANGGCICICCADSRGRGRRTRSDGRFPVDEIGSKLTSRDNLGRYAVDAVLEIDTRVRSWVALFSAANIPLLGGFAVNLAQNWSMVS